MGKKVKKPTEARTKEDRKKVRKQLGSLKSLTVQPVTKQRYQEGLKKFFKFLKDEDLSLPTKRDDMDNLVSDYLEHLWSEGEGRACASTFMAAIQDFDPKLRRKLPGSWRLLRTWNLHETPCRAPPITEAVLHAMVGWAIFHKHFEFGLSLLVAFHTLLRTGELLALQAWQIHMRSPADPAVINLGLTKSGKRQGAAETVTLTDRSTLKWLFAWKQKRPAHAYLTDKPHIWRQMFSDCLQNLNLNQWEFRPYSLRRGGATSYFVKLGTLDRVLIMGRWTALKTAKIYINTGLQMLADIQIPPACLKPFHSVLSSFLHSTPKVEPARKPSRPGARGKIKKSPKKGAKRVKI